MSFGDYRSLQNKYHKIKRELADAEDILRRITGRDPGEIANQSLTGKFKENAALPGSRRLYSLSNRKKASYSSISTKRKIDNIIPVDDDIDDDEESPSKKPALKSTIVAKTKEEKSRQSTIEELNNNSKIKARNRRMFSCLKQTLEQFKDEEKKRQDKESKRALIEEKVEAANEEENRRIKREKEDLFLTRREKKLELRCIEKKLERAETHEVFDTNYRHMMNFIMTKSKPSILYIPNSHTPATRKCFEESRNKVKELIKKRRDLLQNDLAEIEEWYRKDAEPTNKENKCPKDGSESQEVLESESESLIVEQEESNMDDNNDGDDSSSGKNQGSLTDEEFEPIYD